MTIYIAQNIATQIADGQGFELLRRACPPETNQRGFKRWQDSLSSFYEQVGQLRGQMVDGGFVPKALMQRVTRRIDTVQKNAPKSEQGTIQNAKEALSPQAVVEAIQNKRLSPQTPATCSIPPAKKGAWNRMIHFLHFQGSLLGAASPTRAKIASEASPSSGLMSYFASPLVAFQSLFAEPIAEPVVKPAIQPIIEPVAEPRIQKLQKQTERFQKELAKTLNPVLDEPCFAIQTLEEDFISLVDEMRDGLLPGTEALSRYGNKHANLVKMAQVQQKLGLQDLIIPMPRGISTDQVRGFLEKRAPAIFTLWEEIGKLGLPLEAPEVQTRLAEIHQAINKAFKSPGAYEELSPGVDQWLQQLRASGDYLMVRSTGAEDSQKAANAGGNVSKAYVSPTKEALCEAIGEVIRSYFSTPSLQNRIRAGTNPFQEELSLAVTVQQLIGEPVGGAKDQAQIPASFVAFTTEPLYAGSDEFRAMRISVTQGHGEGVVSGQGISSDTILVLHSESQPDQLYILYNNQNKPQRLAPVQGPDRVELGKIDNEYSLVKKRCLDDKAILNLYSYAVAMESAFGNHPTDIEGIVKGGKVYFVQARPINRKEMLPTHLDSVAGAAAIADERQLEMLVPGQGSVVSIGAKEEVLLAATLEEAQGKFNPAQHKLVIVTHPEPANSHPTVNFSEQSVPCLYATDPQAISDLLDKISPDKPLVACMQTARLSLWDSSKAQLTDFISEGFAVHPAKIGISLPIGDHLKPLVARNPSSEIRNLFLNIQGAKTSKRALILLKKLEEHPLVQALQIEAAVDNSGVKERVEALRALGSALHMAIAEVRAVLQQKADTPLKKLIRLKALGSLLFGSTGGGVGQLCLSDAEPILASIEQLSTYKAAFPHGALIDLVLDGQMANQMAGRAWEEFLKDLEPLIQSGKISAEQVQLFKQQIALLKQTGALPFWLTFYQGNTEVGPFTSRKEKTLGRFHQILEHRISETDQVVVDTLLKERTAIQQMESQMNRFADPAQFEAGWKELEEHVGEWSSRALCDAIKQAPPIVQSIAYQTLRDGVTLLDTAIKTMKASPQFETQAKLEAFKRVVTTYVELMKSIGVNLLGANRVPHHEDWPLRLYLDQLDQTFNALKSSDDPQMLRASPNFSVSAAIITAKTAFDRHLPASLEDLMTTAHQNLEAFLAIANEGILTPDQIAKSHLPTALQTAIQNIEGTDWGRRIERVGIEIRGEEIVVRYNVPLRNHSGHIDLHYDVRSGKLFFEGQLLGQARARWGETARWIELLQAASIFPPQGPISQNDLELRFSWKIASQDRLKDALREYVAMAEYSLGNQQYAAALGNVLERWKDRLECEALITNSLKFPETAGMFYRFYLDNFSSTGLLALKKEKLIEALLLHDFSDPLQANIWYELLSKHAISSKKEIAEIVQKTQISQAQKEAIQKWVDESQSEKPLFDLLVGLTDRAKGAQTPNSNGLVLMLVPYVKQGIIPKEFLELAKGTRSKDVLEAFVEQGYLYEEALDYIRRISFSEPSLVQKLIDRGITYQYNPNARKFTFNTELTGTQSGPDLEILSDWSELLQAAGVLTSQSFKDPNSRDQFYSWTLAFPGDFSRVLSEHAQMLGVKWQTRQRMFLELFDRWKGQKELTLMLNHLLKTPKQGAAAFYDFYLKSFSLDGPYPLDHESFVTALTHGDFVSSLGWARTLFGDASPISSKETLIAQIESTSLGKEQKKALQGWIQASPSATPLADLMFEVACMRVDHDPEGTTNLLIDLVERGYRNQAMVEFVKNRPTATQRQATLFQAFIKNGLGHKEALELAHLYKISPEPRIQPLAIDLFTELVKTDASEEAYENALQAAFEFPKMYYYYPRMIVPLLGALIDKGYEVEKIAKWVVEYLAETGAQEVDLLLEKLFDLDYGDEPLLKLTISFADSDLYGDQRKGLQFFQKLAQRGVGLWEARQAALKLIESEDSRTRESAMELLFILNKNKAK